MTPADLSKISGSLAAELRFKDKFMMTYRPRICPFHILIDHVPQGSNILDIGCGSGLWLFILSRLGRISSGTGIDVSRHGIEIAESIKKEDDKLIFHELGDREKWPSGDYHCLSMIDVLHHVDPADRDDFFDKVGRSSAKRIIFKDIDPGAWVKSKMNTLHDILLSHQVPRYSLPDEVAEMIKSKGYSLVEKKRCDMLWYSHFLLVFDKE